MLKNRQFSVRDGFKTALIAALILAVVVLMLRQQPEPVPPVNLSVPATPAPAVKHKPKQKKAITAKTIEVYPSSVKAESKLPEAVVEDQNKEVVASSQVKPDYHPQTITTLIDTETGKFETYYKRDPSPWFARDDSGEAGVTLGLKNGEPAVRLEARQNMFQVKAVHFGGYGSVEQTLNGEQENDWMIGVGAWYRW